MSRIIRWISMNISYFWDLLGRYVPVEKVVTDHIRLLLAGFGSRPAAGCSVNLPSSSVHLGGIKKIPKVPGKVTNVDKTVPSAPSPSHHHFYRWYGYHSLSWVVYDCFTNITRVGGLHSQSLKMSWFYFGVHLTHQYLAAFVSLGWSEMMRFLKPHSFWPEARTSRSTKQITRNKKRYRRIVATCKTSNGENDFFW